MHPLHASFVNELIKVGARAARSTLTSSSSNVRGFRYDAGSKQLFVTFKSGGTYRYDDVPPRVAKAVGRAKSVGRALNKHVKGGGFAYEKVSMPAEMIARAVRSALAKDPDRVARFITRTGSSHGKEIALREARSFLSGTRTFAGKRPGNVLAPVSGEFRTRFGAGEGLPKEAAALVDLFQTERRSIMKIAGVAKSQVTWQGLPMKIEYEPGDVRSGTSKDGKKWEREMHDAYGYVPGTKGKAADGDAIDVYFHEHPVDGPVFKIRQLKKDTGEFDEDKFMVGYPSAEEAKKAYLRHMPEWAFGDLSQVGKTFDDFKNFVRN